MELLGTDLGGMFWKAVPKERWPTDKDYLASIEKEWVEPFGDMRQELVFIGQNLKQDEMVDALNDCLLSEDELLQGKAEWAKLPDPFPTARIPVDKIVDNLCLLTNNLRKVSMIIGAFKKSLNTPSAPKPSNVKISNKIKLLIYIYLFLFLAVGHFDGELTDAGPLTFRSIIDRLLGVLMPKSPSNHGFSLTQTGLLSIMPARI